MRGSMDVQLGWGGWEGGEKRISPGGESSGAGTMMVVEVWDAQGIRRSLI